MLSNSNSVTPADLEIAMLLPRSPKRSARITGKCYHTWSVFEIYLHQRLFFYMKSDYISVLTLVKEHLNISTY